VTLGPDRVSERGRLVAAAAAGPAAIRAAPVRGASGAPEPGEFVVRQRGAAISKRFSWLSTASRPCSSGLPPLPNWQRLEVFGRLPW